MKKKVLTIMLLFITLSTLTGCWDSVEIQERTLIYALAIDKPKTEKEEDRYELTIHIAEPLALSDKPIPGTEPIWNVSTTGSSLFECVRKFATIVARPGYYGHLQLILIGEELAKEGIADSLDLFFRDHEMRRRTKVVIVKGTGKEALQFKHRLIPIPGDYITTLTDEAVRKTSLMPISSTLGEFSVAYRSGTNFVLPNVKVKKNHVDMSGAAILRKDKFAGYISGEDVRAYRVVKGTFTKGAYLATPFEKEKEHPLSSFEVKNMRTHIKPSVKNQTPHFEIEVLVEGSLAEDGIEGFVSDKKLREIEQSLSDKLKKDTLAFIKKMQEEYKMDIFELGEEMRRHEYDYWKTVEKDWDEAFSKAEITLEVTTYIRRTGRIRQ
ncbi:Ger(x)C family spore germination protein [Bacillus timonensis]|nr:Ger(x)C family spore germination protein [Bacillus timonensis]